MERLYFNSEQLDKISLMSVSGFNNEARIYRYEDYVLKYFNIEIDRYTKEMLLLEFDKNRQDIVLNLPEIVMPEFLFYFKNIFRGYLMQFIEGRTLKSVLRDDSISFDKKRECLVKLGEFLEKIDNVRKNNSKLSTLYLNDLHANNVMVTPEGGIRILETDSMRFNNVGNFSAYYLEVPYGSELLDLKNKYDIHYDSFLLSEGIEYEEMRANRESDMYCYIMMILEFICGEDIHEKSYVNYKNNINSLLKKGLPVELFEIFMNIYSEQENVNPYKLLYKLENRILLKES